MTKRLWVIDIEGESIPRPPELGGNRLLYTAKMYSAMDGSTDRSEVLAQSIPPEWSIAKALQNLAKSVAEIEVRAKERGKQ